MGTGAPQRTLRRSLLWGLSAACVVSVACAGGGPAAPAGSSQPPPTGTPLYLAKITVLLDPQSIDVGRKASAAIVGVDNLGNRIGVGAVTWQSSVQAVATVDATGLVSALAPGTTSITATSGTVTGAAQFTVAALAVPPVGVRISPPAATIAFGDSLQLSAATIAAAGDTIYTGPYTWQSSAPAVASVSGAGLVHAIAPGVTVVRASANGLSGSVALTVSAFVDTTLHVNLATPQPGSVVGDSVQIILTVTQNGAIARIARMVATVDAAVTPLDTMWLGAFASVQGWGKLIPLQNFPIGVHRLILTAYAFSQAISADTLAIDREVEQTGGTVPVGGRKQFKPPRPAITPPPKPPVKPGPGG